MTSNVLVTAPLSETPSFVSQGASQPASAAKTNRGPSKFSSYLSTHTDEEPPEQRSRRAEDVEAAAQAHQQQGGASIYEAPPVPVTRGPGHTPRGRTREGSQPPRRLPSRTSFRHGTPRGRGDDVTTTLIPKPHNPRVNLVSQASIAPSDTSVHFLVDEEQTDAKSISFQAEPSTNNFNTTEVSLNLQTITEGSDIHFVVEQSRLPSQAVALKQGGTPTTRSSLCFEVESTNDATRNSTISRFSIEGNEPEQKPLVPTSHLRVEHKDNSAEKVAPAMVENAREPQIEFVGETEEQRRAKKAEEERRKQVLKERSLYMSIRPWSTNEPDRRARRTSSESAAHALKQQLHEKMAEVEKRRRAMYARPWRTDSASPNTSRSASRTNRKRRFTPLSGRSGDGVAMSELPATESKSMQAGNKRAPAALAACSYSSSLSSEERSSPTAPAYDCVEAAKFVTPAPVLKTPLEIVCEEFEDWVHTVNQRCNLKAIADMMRARERTIVQLSSQLEDQSRVMKRLNKELYDARDEYMRHLGNDVTGLALHAPRSRATSRSPGRISTSRTPSVVRLHVEQRHRAKDYYSMKMQQLGPRPVSVLSDDELSDSEKEVYAQELQSWRVERAALRDEKARLVHCRRDLAFQMRRGSNIKDIATTQPTSGRGPLERAATGTETAVDVKGYDRLMDLRMRAQRAVVETANAKKVYEATLCMAATMKKQHDPSSAELKGAKESRRKARELYAASLQRLQQSAEEARSLLERATALKTRREKAAESLDESVREDQVDYGDAVLAVRLQADRAQALAEAAADDEDRMLRSPSTVRLGVLRAGTPRGSVNGSMRPGTSAHTRGASTSNGDDVFARLTERR
ncbi:protein of unknown function - conserved [Leishmania donovani]|uniref:Hypothetical_protein_conserved n=1 Tax=Leishmania donovani TaxID=5661 RepID=A0A504XKA8_LEIDO|nr:hypothetical protein CGC20_26710 [Leishmania donovani]CAJ1989436.1 protein of unknown function - conserved [Leishmania donovani]VDZ45303.1 hypothetical_protein_conserved [Leishmania donovani]